jgi:hypothetical protein
LWWLSEFVLEQWKCKHGLVMPMKNYRKTNTRSVHSLICTNKSVYKIRAEIIWLKRLHTQFEKTAKKIYAKLWLWKWMVLKCFPRKMFFLFASFAVILHHLFCVEMWNFLSELIQFYFCLHSEELLNPWKA